MKTYLALVPVVLALALALPATAAASRYNRNCGTARDGWILGPENADYESPWVVNGPFHIKMTKGLVQSTALAKLWPVQEFGYRIKPSAIPCLLAQDIASSASRAWVNWTGNSGTATVQWEG